MVLLIKTKLNIVEVLFSRALTDSSISHNKFVVINDVLKEYDNNKRNENPNNQNTCLML